MFYVVGWVIRVEIMINFKLILICLFNVKDNPPKNRKNIPFYQKWLEGKTQGKGAHQTQTSGRLIIAKCSNEISLIAPFLLG